MEITNFLLKLSVCINNIWILWIAVHWIQLIYPFILKQYTQTFLSCHRLCSYVEIHLLPKNQFLATLLWFHLFFYFISFFFFSIYVVYDFHRTVFLEIWCGEAVLARQIQNFTAKCDRSCYVLMSCHILFWQILMDKLHTLFTYYLVTLEEYISVSTIWHTIDFPTLLRKALC